MNEKNGHTIFELVVVIAIMVALLGISSVFFHNFGRGAELKYAARQIAGALRTARSEAVTKGKPYSVLFDTINEKYWIEDNRNRILDKQFSVPYGVDIVDISNDVSQPPSGNQPAVHRFISFQPTGRALEARSVHIARVNEPMAVNILINNPDRRKCFTVTATTAGAIRFYDYGRNAPWSSGDMP